MNPVLFGAVGTKLCQHAKLTLLDRTKPLFCPTFYIDCAMFFLSGANVEIMDSFIWDNVVIADSCHVYNGVLCERVKLHKKTKLGRPAGSLGDGKKPPEFILSQEVSIATSCSIQFFSQLKDTFSCGPI